MTEAFSFRRHSEFDPELEFQAVLGELRTRLGEAVRLQHEVPEYYHFVISDHPQAPDMLAKFVLADDYESMRRGEGEKFELSLPILAPDYELPEPKDAGYFFLKYQHGRKFRTLLVDDQVYARRFVYSRRPPIEHFQQKLLIYQLVPARKPV